MSWKEFLRPEFKKLILPFIIIILFILVVIVIENLPQYACQLRDLYVKWYPSDNKTLEIEKQNLINDMKKYEYLGYIYVVPYLPIRFLNPFFPEECALLTTNPEKCIFSMSKEEYNCWVEIMKIAGHEVEPYKTFTIDMILINLLFLFFTYYFVSCIIIWIYNKVKKK
jgi:hypothetical protein